MPGLRACSSRVRGLGDTPPSPRLPAVSYRRPYLHVEPSPLPGSDAEALTADVRALARAVRLTGPLDDPLAQALVATVEGLLGEPPGAVGPADLAEVAGVLKQALAEAPRDWPWAVARANAVAAEAAARARPEVRDDATGPSGPAGPGEHDTISSGTVAREERIRQSNDSLERLTRSYASDARRQARVSTFLYVAAVALAGVGVALSGIVVLRAEFRALEPGAVVARLLPSALLLALAVLCGRQAALVRRGAFELDRQRRQLVGLSGYLLPLPVPTQDLLRAAMVPRLFPRLLEDDDPTREDDWFPDGDQLLVTVDPDLAELLARPDDHDDDPGPGLVGDRRGSPGVGEGVPPMADPSGVSGGG